MLPLRKGGLSVLENASGNEKEAGVYEKACTIDVDALCLIANDI